MGNVVKKFAIYGWNEAYMVDVDTYVGPKEVISNSSTLRREENTSACLPVSASDISRRSRRRNERMDRILTGDVDINAGSCRVTVGVGISQVALKVQRPCQQFWMTTREIGLTRCW